MAARERPTSDLAPSPRAAASQLSPGVAAADSNNGRLQARQPAPSPINSVIRTRSRRSRLLHPPSAAIRSAAQQGISRRRTWPTLARRAAPRVCLDRSDAASFTVSLQYRGEARDPRPHNYRHLSFCRIPRPRGDQQRNRQSGEQPLPASPANTSGPAICRPARPHLRAATTHANVPSAPRSAPNAGEHVAPLSARLGAADRRTRGGAEKTATHSFTRDSPTCQQTRHASRSSCVAMQIEENSTMASKTAGGELHAIDRSIAHSISHANPCAPIDTTG